MLNIPNNTIVAISHDKKWQTKEYLNSIFGSLRGQFKREWFVPHAYYCLPLFMGNQYGFVLKSYWNFEAEWNGGDKPEDVSINILDDKNKYNWEKPLQSVKPHFGMGTFTIQTTFTLRTPPGVNLITINTPNNYIDGLYCMTGVIETDNLRRDFSFNTRITRPNYKIKVKKGDILGCVLPYPRHFIDQFEIMAANEIFEEKIIEEERKCGKDFGEERSQKDKHKPRGNGRRYYNGEDIYGNKFCDHQTKLDRINKNL
jgi:hypothetical protein